MKIYTKAGDTGMTSLVGGTRVSKTSPRLEAYGTIDEAMSHIAFLRDNLDATEVRFVDMRNDLLTALRTLMNASAIMAAEEEILAKMPQVTKNDIEYLENRIDYLQAELPQITKFTVPGGHPLVSMAHIARTVTRRAERAVIAVDNADRMVIGYINRLSDYLYVAGRSIANEYNVEEVLWVP